MDACCERTEPFRNASPSRYLIADSFLLKYNHTYLGNYYVIAFPGLNVESAAWLAHALVHPDVRAFVFAVGTNDCQSDPPAHLNRGQQPARYTDNPLVAHQAPLIYQARHLLLSYPHLVSIRFLDLPLRPAEARRPFHYQTWFDDRSGSNFQRVVRRINKGMNRNFPGNPDRLPISVIPVHRGLLSVWHTFPYNDVDQRYAMHLSAFGIRRIEFVLKSRLRHD